MEITVAQQGSVAVVSLIGVVDALAAEQVGNALSAQVKDGKTRLVADFSRVDTINSVGLRALVQTQKDIHRKGGDFRLAGIRPSVRKALEITGLTSLFKVYPDVEAAVASFAAP